MSEKCNNFLSAFHAYLSSQILRNLFSHLLYRIHNLPDLLSGNSIDMHATGADGHGRHNRFFPPASGTVPHLYVRCGSTPRKSHSSSRLRSAIPVVRPAPHSRYAAFLLRRDRSESPHRASLPSLPSCILRLLPFLSAFFPSPVLLYFHAERRKQFGRKMCHHIVDGLRFLIKGHHRRNNPYI